jgi:hypothetical protein
MYGISTSIFATAAAMVSGYGGKNFLFFIVGNVKVKCKDFCGRLKVDVGHGMIFMTPEDGSYTLPVSILQVCILEPEIHSNRKVEQLLLLSALV